MVTEIKINWQSGFIVLNKIKAIFKERFTLASRNFQLIVNIFVIKSQMLSDKHHNTKQILVES